MQNDALEDKRRIDHTRDVVQVLNKTFNTMRIFTPDHPSWAKFKRDIVRKFEEYLDAYGELAIGIEESKLQFRGVPVFEEETKRHSLTFMLYTDGVREFVFEAGLPPAEIQDVIDTFIENSRIPEEERDIVCLLWEKNFPHVHYVTVEDLPDPETAALIAEMTQEMPFEEMLPSRIELHAQDQERVEEGKRASYRKVSRAAYLAHLKEQFEQPEGQTAIAISDQPEAKEVLDLIEKEYVFNPNEEMAHFLLEVLHKEETDKKYDQYAHLSENFYEKIITFSDFRAASQFLEGLNELSDSLRIQSPVQAERIDDSLREMSSREKIEGLERVINEGMPFKSEDFYEYLLLLRPNAIDPLCDLLGRIGSPQIKTYIYKALEQLARGHEQILGQKLREVPVEVERGLINLIGNMRARKVISHLKPIALERSSPLRYDTIQTLRKIGGKEANALFIELLNDPDSDIRSAAARSIDLDCELTHAAAVLNMVVQRDFEKRSMIEKKALLEYVGSSMSEEGFPVLAKLLRKKSLFSRHRATETRICAAFGLSKYSSKEAYTVLREQINTRNPRVRETCKSILRGAGELIQEEE